MQYHLISPSHDLGRYDAVEVSPVREWHQQAHARGGDYGPLYEIDGRPVMETIAEVCEPSDAMYWSVYLHTRGIGAECVCDCPDEVSAQLLAKGLSAVLVALRRGRISAAIASYYDQKGVS